MFSFTLSPLLSVRLGKVRKLSFLFIYLVNPVPGTVLGSWEMLRYNLLNGIMLKALGRT